VRSYGVSVEKIEVKAHLVGQGVDGDVIMKTTGTVWTELIWLWKGTGRRVFVITVMNIRIPLSEGNFLSS